MPISGRCDRDIGGVDPCGARVSGANRRADAYGDGEGGFDAILEHPDGVGQGDDVSDGGRGVGRVPDGGLMVNDD